MGWSELVAHRVHRWVRLLMLPSLPPSLHSTIQLILWKLASLGRNFLVSTCCLSPCPTTKVCPHYQILLDSLLKFLFLELESSGDIVNSQTMWDICWLSSTSLVWGSFSFSRCVQQDTMHCPWICISGLSESQDLISSSFRTDMWLWWPISTLLPWCIGKTTLPVIFCGCRIYLEGQVSVAGATESKHPCVVCQQQAAVFWESGAWGKCVPF